MATFTSGTTSTSWASFITGAGNITSPFSPSSNLTGGVTSPNGFVYYYVSAVAVNVKGYDGTSSVSFICGTSAGASNVDSTSVGSVGTSAYSLLTANTAFVVRNGLNYHAGPSTASAGGIYSTRTSSTSGGGIYHSGSLQSGLTNGSTSDTYFRLTYVPMPNTSGTIGTFSSTSSSISFNVPSTSGAIGYRTQYSTDQSTWTTVNLSSGSNSVTGLSPNTTYYFRHAAYNDAYNISINYAGPFSSVTSYSTITDIPAPTMDSTPLTSGRVGQYYNTNVYPSSGTATSVTVSGLPAGLAYTDYGSYANVYGTPTASGTYSPSFYASNSGGNSGWVSKSLSIFSPYSPSVSSTSFAQGTQNTAYGSSTITFYNTLDVTGAPATLAGLSVNANSSGVTLSGTPTSSGTFNMNLTLIGATDNGNSNNYNVTLSVYIVANDPSWPAYTFPDGKVNANYSSTITATNAQSVTGNISPAGNGLTVTASGTSSLIVSGVPTVSGTYTVNGTANGAAGTTPATFSKTFYVAPLVPPTWTDTSLGLTMTVGVPYATTSGGNNTLAATNATAFSIVGGTSLPAGLTGSTAAGVWTLSGTPTTRAAYTFTVRASNADGNATPDQTFVGTVTHPPTWIDQTLADFYQGRAFSDSLSVSTSTAITWSVLGIPAGVVYAASGTNNSVLTLSGTPTGTGNYSIITRATNGDGYIEKTFDITMKLPPNWTDNQLGSFVQGVEYFDSVVATNSPTYEVSVGALPTGISLNTSTGAVTGIATILNEAYSFTIRAYTVDGEVTQAFSGNVQPDLGGGVKVYNGTNWTTLGNQMVHVYDGSTWVEGKTYTYNGNIWVKSLF